MIDFAVFAQQIIDELTKAGRKHTAKTHASIEQTGHRRAKVPLAYFGENNFFQKTFGGIIEKVYLCTQKYN